MLVGVRLRSLATLQYKQKLRPERRRKYLGRMGEGGLVPAAKRGQSPPRTKIMHGDKYYL